MKLYYSPGACSQAPHIALIETGLPFTLAKVDLATKRLDTGEDFNAINPKSAVPAIEMDDGGLLTENAVVLQYIADRAPAARLIPPVGTLARYRVLEWLNYLASELHPGFGPLFHPTGEPRAHAVAALEAELAFVDGRLGAGPYLGGDDLSVADLYLFVILGWPRILHVDLARWPALAAFRARLLERPSVRAALHAEGLAPR